MLIDFLTVPLQQPLVAMSFSCSLLFFSTAFTFSLNNNDLCIISVHLHTVYSCTMFRKIAIFSMPVLTVLARSNTMIPIFIRPLAYPHHPPHCWTDHSGHYPCCSCCYHHCTCQNCCCCHWNCHQCRSCSAICLYHQMHAQNIVKWMSCCCRAHCSLITFPAIHTVSVTVNAPVTVYTSADTNTIVHMPLHCRCRSYAYHCCLCWSWQSWNSFYVIWNHCHICKSSALCSCYPSLLLNSCKSHHHCTSSCHSCYSHHCPPSLSSCTAVINVLSPLSQLLMLPPIRPSKTKVSHVTNHCICYLHHHLHTCGLLAACSLFMHARPVCHEHFIFDYS